MIEKQRAIVFYSPAKGRRYFTQKAAIEAEARAIIFKKYPVEEADDCCNGWHIMYDEPERYKKMHSKLCAIIKRRFDYQEFLRRKLIRGL